MCMPDYLYSLILIQCLKAQAAEGTPDEDRSQQTKQTRTHQPKLRAETKIPAFGDLAGLWV